MTAENRQRMRYLVADYISTNIALLIFNVFRYYDLPIAYNSFHSLEYFLFSPVLVAGQIIFPLVMLGIYYMSGAYDDVFRRSRTSELTITFPAALAGTLLLFFAVLLNDLTLERSRDYSLFLVLLALMFLLVYIPRLIITWHAAKKIVKGEISFPALIVGYSSVSRLFPLQLEKISPVTGIRPVALVDSENRARVCESRTDLPVHDLNEVGEICGRYGVNRIIVIPHPDGWNRTLEVINVLFSFDIPVYVAASGLPSYIFNTRLLSLIDEPFIDVTQARMSPSMLHFKRLGDIIVSSLGLVVSAVPIAVLALAVKLDSRGPVFYRQKRVGLHRRQFDIIKLRTMQENAEPDGVPVLSHPGDSRITSMGRFMRKYRLDELPQFFNVFRGDMSMVGPRPERPEFVEEMHRREPASTLIHRVRPGITSLGMVRYGYASTIDGIMHRLQYDLLYLENISLATDLKIILHTVNTVLSGKGV